MPDVSNPSTPLRVLIVGHGRMGQIIESLCPSYDCQVAGWVDEQGKTSGVSLTPESLAGVDVAIDFSIADAFTENFPKLAALGLNVVVGTTGWKDREADMRAIAERAGIGVVAAPNFSVGVAIFQEIVAHASSLFARQPRFGAWLHEIHHAAKLDAPSGTALALKATMEAAGLNRPIDVASSRVGLVPGTHTIGFDGPSETVTLIHTARDRVALAHGAVAAALGPGENRGWFSLRDVLGLDAQS